METKSSHHDPVLIQEIIESATGCTRGILHFLDCTFGRGGHTRRLLQTFPSAKATATDQDPEALQYGRDVFSEEISAGRLNLVQTRFADYLKETKENFDFILMDLGVSSPQLDQGQRGFSFLHDGPLDMRMNPNVGPKASDLIHDSEEEELMRIFKELGEVRNPFRVVRALVHDRKTIRFETTKQLADMIARIDGWKRKGFHPATQYFMALRLAVNEELDQVAESLEPAMRRLNEDGRLAVISFHSL
ncbi:MAG: 16S rRNA (cytosine(1402)-N(4))-methyltransferase RsmH, partial [Bdellovibrionales bacterium]|nr:16S rRNA (cytosine(1402)-N(4))-methyltransferase RsmH [Bdellovibrionales bacterium]